MAKLLAARTAWANADNALQIHGGNGYATEYAISRVLCDARILNIFEGRRRDPGPGDRPWIAGPGETERRSSSPAELVTNLPSCRHIIAGPPTAFEGRVAVRGFLIGLGALVRGGERGAEPGSGRGQPQQRHPLRAGRLCAPAW